MKDRLEENLIHLDQKVRLMMMVMMMMMMMMMMVMMVMVMMMMMMIMMIDDDNGDDDNDDLLLFFSYTFRKPSGRDMLRVASCRWVNWNEKLKTTRGS